MSRPRSPHHSHRMSPRRYEDRGDPRPQRFPWDEPTFDPERVLADLDRDPWEEGAEDLMEQLIEEELNRRAQRRHAHSPGRHHHRPEHRPERHHHLSPVEYHHGHHGRSPPPPPLAGYGDVGRPSPKPLLRERDGGGGGRGGARGGGFREEPGRFEERDRPPRSPQRPPRERMPSAGHAHPADPHHREPSAGWGREEQPRGQGRSRERIHNHGRGRGGGGGGGEPHGLFQDRRREELQRDRSPHSDRYEREPEFREQRRSLERGPGERKDGPWGGFSPRGGRGPRPLLEFVDHSTKGDGGGPPPRREAFDERRDRGASRENLHYRAGSSQERFRKPNSREEARGHVVGHDGRREPGQEARRSSPVHPDGRNSPVHREARRSPVYHQRTSPMGVPPGREGAGEHRDRASQGNRGRSGQAHRGRGNPSRGGRMNQPHQQTFPPGRGRPRSPQQPQRQSVRPQDLDWDADSRGEEEQQEPQSSGPRWENDRQRGRGRPHPGGRMDPEMPRAREQKSGWNQTQNSSNVETLTIKVDMNCRVGQNSQPCYSSDRQLSFDLVNVGRQRLDFLPMLQHSGTYRENAMHSGTFAQEIISLVHKVKEHYFKGDSVTLNQRFSGPQEGGEEGEEEEEEEEMEEERPTLNKRFNMNMKMMVRDTKPLFSNVGHSQPRPPPLMSDPADLRHDLERRRQERLELEGVKVTIPGGSLSQRPLGLGREQNEDYLSEEEEEMMMEEFEDDDGGVSGWTGQGQGRRWAGHTGPRRGAGFRQNTSAQRQNYRPGNHPGNGRYDNGPDW